MVFYKLATLIGVKLLNWCLIEESLWSQELLGTTIFCWVNQWCHDVKNGNHDWYIYEIVPDRTRIMKPIIIGNCSCSRWVKIAKMLPNGNQNGARLSNPYKIKNCWSKIAMHPIYPNPMCHLNKTGALKKKCFSKIIMHPCISCTGHRPGGSPVLFLQIFHILILIF